MNNKEAEELENYERRVTPYNVRIYGIGEAMISAGYSMAVNVSEMPAHAEERDINRAERLGKAPGGSGEDKFLRFIHIDFDWCLPRYMWQEVDTYHFIERNSQSTMHRITQMDLTEACNPFVSVVEISYLANLIADYKNARGELAKFAWLKLKANIPEGLMLTSRVSTNYSTLKTIYNQRKYHRNLEWRVFCAWIETLPLAVMLGVCGGN